ncbi:TPA: hypothetical protein QHO33_004601 [Citrobacter freundii]|nr:hypothetical protein [Citrobacter freundii]MDU4809576.1 hypothetical protein [Citrobacter freundii]HAU5688487.1 hypothetical protein [Citrobacter freundii]HDT2574747.1 hypothetical protein [Citrobacter freundii]
MKGVRLHGLDLSTKHVVFDSREPDIWRALRKRLEDWVMSRPSASPEYEKGRHMAALFEYKLATLVILFTWR